MSYARHIVNTLIITFSLITLAGCGPSGGTPPPPTQENPIPLTLTIGDQILQTSKTETITLDDRTQVITTVHVSDGGTIALGGEDSDLFTIDGINLKFKEPVDAWAPIDHDYNGTYELTILATKGAVTIRYQVTYRVEIPVSAADLLIGKSFWIDRSKAEKKINTFYHQIFHDETFDNQYITEYDKENTDISLYDIPITYYRDTFSYTVDGTTLICTLQKQSPLTFECADETRTQTVVMLEEKPPFVIPESWKVSAAEEDIHNIYEYQAPQIESMVVSGNHEADDGMAVIIRNGKNDNKFIVEANISNESYLKSLTVHLNHNAEDIAIWNYTGLPDKQQTVTCTFDKMDATTIQFTCDDNNTVIDDDAANTTHIQMTVCDTEDPLDSEAQCNWAQVPVGFFRE